ncbi:hypothetical protein KAR91_73725 [Candidatus Pacearchaeota archaeon]|nr:hypothetical protein [Candidatus Pacearchaeota archaeon]
MIGKLKYWEDLYQKSICTFDKDQYMVYHETSGMYIPVWVGHIYNFGHEIKIEPYSIEPARTIYQEVGNPDFKMYDCWFEYIQTNPFNDYEFFTDDDLRITI